MNNTKLRLCLLFIFALSFSGVFAAEDQRAAQRKIMRSPAMQKMQRNGMKQMLRSFWNGDATNLMAIGLMQQDDFRQGIGVTKETGEKFNMQTAKQNIMSEPEFKQIQEESVKLMKDMPGGPFGENVPEETLQKFLDLQMKQQNLLFSKMNKIADDNLTSDQKQKVKEFQISAMSEIPIVSPNMFEALNLSNDQKKKLDDIKKELEPDFEKNMDSMIDGKMKMAEKFSEELDGKITPGMDSKEIRKIVQEVQAKIRKENPEYVQLEKEIMVNGKTFSEKLKFRMFDVLTKEQMERMAQLVDNPPDYVKKMIGQIRKEMGHDDTTEAEGAWKPGIDSWKPGEPIPEEYRKRRNLGGFPKK